MITKFKIQYLILCFCLCSLCKAQNKTKISIDSMPIRIKQHINRWHSFYQISYSEKFIDSNKQVFYKIILQKKNKEIDIIYTEKGKKVSSKKSKYYTDDGTTIENNYKTPFPNL